MGRGPLLQPRAVAIMAAALTFLSNLIAVHSGSDQHVTFVERCHTLSRPAS